jgi:hypothetical protein
MTVVALRIGNIPAVMPVIAGRDVDHPPWAITVVVVAVGIAPGVPVAVVSYSKREAESDVD